MSIFNSKQLSLISLSLSLNLLLLSLLFIQFTIAQSDQVSAPIYANSTVTQTKTGPLSIKNQLTVDGTTSLGEASVTSLKIGNTNYTLNTISSATQKPLQVGVQGAVGAESFCAPDGTNCWTAEQIRNKINQMDSLTCN